MPFRSKAQQRKLESLASQGKFPQKSIEEWEQATKAQPGGFKGLPEKVSKPKPLPQKSQPVKKAPPSPKKTKRRS